MNDDEFQTAAADAAVELLSRLYPAAAEVCAPFLRRLFAALEDGHSFIWLTDEEAETLAQAAPLTDSKGLAPLVLRGRRLFLGRFYRLERDLAGEIRRLAVPPAEIPETACAAELLAEWFAQAGSEGQQAAAALALLQNFILISGGPGTGKTTTVAKLLALLCQGRERLPRIALAAPTGKAAAHMARALHKALAGFSLSDGLKRHLSALEGQTVHRLLKLRPPQMQPQFDADNPLPLDILIIDEASMLDLALMLNLLRAVPDGCRVILLGDENQLPSVGAGAVLASLAQTTILDGETAGRLKTLLPQRENPFQTASNPPALSANTARWAVWRARCAPETRKPLGRSSTVSPTNCPSAQPPSNNWPPTSAASRQTTGRPPTMPTSRPPSTAKAIWPYWRQGATMPPASTSPAATTCNGTGAYRRMHNGLPDKSS